MNLPPPSIQPNQPGMQNIGGQPNITIGPPQPRGPYAQNQRGQQPGMMHQSQIKSNMLVSTQQQ